MARWCRNVANRAVDCISIPPSIAHHPDIAKLFEECPDAVEDGWYYWEGGWHATPEPCYHTLLTIPEFKSLFTVEERIRLKKARYGTDTIPVDEILADYWELMEEFGEVDLTSNFAEEAMTYLVSANYITAARKEIIMRGLWY